jgi:hypothetical protein
MLAHYTHCFKADKLEAQGLFRRSSSGPVTHRIGSRNGIRKRSKTRKCWWALSTSEGPPVGTRNRDLSCVEFCTPGELWIINVLKSERQRLAVKKLRTGLELIMQVRAE